jgi:putative transposase
MIKSYKFRIYPSKKQIRILNQHLEECRWLYNYCIEERREARKREKKSLSCFDQQNKLIELKRNKTSLNNVYSQALQDVVKRVDLAFKGFYRRVKNGEKPGYPRFKGKNRYNSLTYPQLGFTVDTKGNNIQLSKIGTIKAKITQTIEGKLKTCTVKRYPIGKWYVILTCEFEPKPLPKNDKIVGIDVGIKHFVVLSDGNRVENPKFILKEEENIAKAQRKLSKLTKGTKEWEKQRKVVARIYERITWKRQDFIHKLSREIVNKYGIVVIEDLNVNKMVRKKKNKKRSLSKLILDAAWADFCHKLAYKAEWAGRQIVAVNPKYTSQVCSECGFREEMPLNKRKFRCRNCGLELDRDHNAARNIERLGRQSLRGNPLEACDP